MKLRINEHIFVHPSSSGPQINKPPTAQTENQQTSKLTGLSTDLFGLVVEQLTKKDAASLNGTSHAYRQMIKGNNCVIFPIDTLRNDFLDDVKTMPSTAPIPAYMTDHVRELTGHTATVYTVIQLDDKRLVSGSRDTTLRIWDLSQEKEAPGCCQVLTGHTDWVSTVIQLADGRLVSGSRDRTLRVWGRRPVPKTSSN